MKLVQHCLVKDHQERTPLSSIGGNDPQDLSGTVSAPTTSDNRTKRKLPSTDSDKKRKKKKTSKPPSHNLKGNRIFNLQTWNEEMKKVLEHHKTCPKNSTPELVSEVNRVGLACKLQYKCRACGMNLVVETQPRQRGPVGSKHRYTINVTSVWGIMSTGGGHSQMDEILSMMDIPCMSHTAFGTTETFVGQLWEQQLARKIIEAGKAERSIAVRENSYDEQMPAIAVTVDGGWSQRSFGHRYSANSGVGVIIGEKTRKILYLGIRNKYCSICAIAKSRDQVPSSHTCFKNWTASSGAMEADIISEGFGKSEEMHGLRYTILVGDGDSSTYKTVVECCNYGHRVKKMECANHAIKCFRKNLHKLVEDNSKYKGKGGLTALTIKKISAGARAAIRMHSETKNIQQLRKDLRNGPYHVFGDHERCNVAFCRRKEAMPSSNVGDIILPTCNSKNENCDIDDETANVDDDITQCDENSARTAGNSHVLDKLPLGLMNEIQRYIDRLESLAPQLIGNFTSNSAESYMNINAKFNGGKQICRNRRGAYQYRCNGAALAFQHGGAGWHEEAWSEIFQTPPGDVATGYCDKATKKGRETRKRQASNDYKETRRRSKYAKCHSEQSMGKDYGPNAQEPDISADDLERLCLDVIQERYAPITKLTQRNIETETLGQSENPLWMKYRKERITASNFGDVVRRRKTTPCAKLVKRLLYSSGPRYLSRAVKWGIDHEDQARKEYMKKTGYHVRECGLFVDSNDSWLAGSPDGIVLSDDLSNLQRGLLEIKCLHKAFNLDLDPMEAAIDPKCRPNFCSELNKDNGELMLKKTHGYYYQVQGQLHVADYDWCDFVLWTPKGMHVQRIKRDNELWAEKMYPKLKDFFLRCLLPEIVAPRHTKNMPIREPKENDNK